MPDSPFDRAFFGGVDLGQLGRAVEETFHVVHEKALSVRIDKIKELQPWFHGEYRVILQDGTQLTLSRNHREKLQEALGKLP